MKSILDNHAALQSEVLKIAEVAGYLWQNVRVLGEIGDVLILANESDYRFYFVCRSAADFLG